MSKNPSYQMLRNKSVYTGLNRIFHSFEREIDALLVCPFLSDEEKANVQIIYSHFLFIKTLL